MLGLCWVPLVIVGGNYALQTDWHHSEHITAPFVEVQTCRDGLGAHLAGGPEPWVAGGIHYGWTQNLGQGWSVTLQPKAGLSYSNTMHPWQGRQVTKFEVGLNLLVCWDRWCGVAGYRHMSNGKGYDPSNAGVDFLEGGVGIQLY